MQVRGSAEPESPLPLSPVPVWEGDTTPSPTAALARAHQGREGSRGRGRGRAGSRRQERTETHAHWLRPPSPLERRTLWLPAVGTLSRSLVEPGEWGRCVGSGLQASARESPREQGATSRAHIPGSIWPASQAGPALISWEGREEMTEASSQVPALKSSPRGEKLPEVFTCLFLRCTIRCCCKRYSR